MADLRPISVQRMLTPNGLMTAKDIERLATISPATRRRWLKTGRLPKPTAFNPRVWHAKDILRWWTEGNLA